MVPDGDKDVVPADDNVVPADGHNSVVEEVPADDNVVLVRKDGELVLCSLFLLPGGGMDAAELQPQQKQPAVLTHCPSL